MTLIGEHWQDTQGQQLKYWRIEKADFVIVLPIQHDHLGQSHILGVASSKDELGRSVMQCPECGATHIRKNGKRKGKQNHICVACGRQFIDAYEPH